jgi:hypothetical protein
VLFVGFTAAVCAAVATGTAVVVVSVFVALLQAEASSVAMASMAKVDVRRIVMMLP